MIKGVLELQGETTHKFDECPINPAKYIWPVITFRSVGGHTSHQYGRRLLVESGRQVLSADSCINPTKIDSMS